MKWMRERDALIAQTLAFVQSVTGRRTLGEPPPPVVPEIAPPLPPAVVLSPATPAAAETPKTPETAPSEPTTVPRPMVPSDFQREMQGRIATFRAHQERFNREREEYFTETLAKLRAAIKDGPQPRPRD